MNCRLLLPLILLLTTVGVVRAVVDGDRLDQGPRLQLRNPAAQAAYRALYDDLETNPDLLVHRCHRLAGTESLTCLAARLLHRGAATDDRVRVRRERDMALAVLRFFRELRDPSLAPVYDRCLRKDERLDVLRSALVAGLALDGDAVATQSCHLAVPDADGYPGARSKAVRRMAVSVLASLTPAGQAQYHQAIAYTVDHGDPDEAMHVLQMLGGEKASDIAGRIIARFLDRAIIARDPVAAAAVRLALRYFHASSDQEQVTRVLAQLPDAERDFLCLVANRVAAGTLAGPVPLSTIDVVATRLADESDPAARHALQLLLLHWSPTRLLQAVPAADPLAILARRRLEEERSRQAGPGPAEGVQP